MAYMLINNTAQSSEDCTATVKEVKAGTTAVTKDSDDEVVEGTMPDNGAVSITLNAGKTYIIPQGYHNGSGIVTANSLASQTIATAQPSDVLSGYTYYNSGLKTGTLAPTAATNIGIGSVGYYNFTVYWTNPSSGPFTGVEVYCDGRLRYRGCGSNKSPGGRSALYLDSLSCASWHTVTIKSYILLGGKYVYHSSMLSSSAYCPSPCCVSRCCASNCNHCENCVGRTYDQCPWPNHH